MPDLQSEYRELLQALQDAESRAALLKEHIITERAANPEFDAMFIRDSLEKNVDQCRETLQSIIRSLRQGSDEIDKYGLLEDYTSLKKQRELLRSPAAHLMVLLAKADAKDTDMISKRIVNGDAEAEIVSYQKNMEALGEFVVDPAAFRAMFALKEEKSEETEAVGITNNASAVKQGSIIRFGTYPQMASGKDKTPIEWRVLTRNGNKAFVISRYGLDARAYHDEFEFITWENCTLRTWLNNDFINTAFSADERKAILTTNVDNSKGQGNSEWNTYGGNNTKDKLFLLSYREAEDYFSGDDARMCEPTDYAVAHGADVFNIDKSDQNYELMKDSDRIVCWWWLRSPGNISNFAAGVYYDGSVDDFGNLVNYDDGAVRPAFWLNLESDIF